MDLKIKKGKLTKADLIAAFTTPRYDHPARKAAPPRQGYLRGVLEPNPEGCTGIRNPNSRRQRRKKFGKNYWREQRQQRIDARRKAKKEVIEIPKTPPKPPAEVRRQQLEQDLLER